MEPSHADRPDNPAKRLKPDYSDTITVLVGPAEKSFIVHQDSIRARSRFFEAACSREWKEAKYKVVRLPEAEFETFKMYVHWIYTGNLDTAFMPEPIDTVSTPSYRNLAKVWTFANFIGDDLLCNKAIDGSLIRLSTHSGWLNKETLRYLCANTSEDAAIRRLHCDIAMARVNVGDMCDMGPDVLPEFARDCMKKFIGGEMRERKDPNFEERCKYHAHEDKEHKCT